MTVCRIDQSQNCYCIVWISGDGNWLNEQVNDAIFWFHPAIYIKLLWYTTPLHHLDPVLTRGLECGNQPHRAHISTWTANQPTFKLQGSSIRIPFIRALAHFTVIRVGSTIKLIIYSTWEKNLRKKKHLIFNGFISPYVERLSLWGPPTAPSRDAIGRGTYHVHDDGDSNDRPNHLTLRRASSFIRWGAGTVFFF